MMYDGFWYRADVRHYSVANEWGDHEYTSTKLVWSKYAVARSTPKGVWLVPAGGEKDPDYYEKLSPGCRLFDKQFVLGKSKRQLACPTREAALKDCLARKERHISGCKARLSAAENDRIHIMGALKGLI